MPPDTAHTAPGAGLLRTLPAPARIAALADRDTVETLDAPRPSPWLERFGVAAQDDDGVVTARVSIEGLPVLVAAQDERFVGGSIGARHGEALERLLRRAIDERPAAVVLLMASGGVRLFEANAAELAAARALRALLDARAAGVCIVSLCVGDVFGGASVMACAAERLAMLPTARLGLSGPRVIETARGRGELDAGDVVAVDRLFGAKARAAAGFAAVVDDERDAIRRWIATAVARTQSLDAWILQMHGRQGADGPKPSPAARPALLAHRPDAVAVDTHGLVWRVGDSLVTAPFTARAFDGVSVHALDGALLTAGAAAGVVVIEDSSGHDVSRAAEARLDSQRLAQHAALLACLRQRGAVVTGLLSGQGHSAAFFANALQATRLVALPTARVVAMEPAAIARVTGRDVTALIEDDPLLGQPVRHFAALGGVDGICEARDALDAALRQ